MRKPLSSLVSDTLPARRKNGFKSLFLTVLFCLFWTGYATPARAACIALESINTMRVIIMEHYITRSFITEQFRLHQDWFFGAGDTFQNGSRDNFWELHIQPGLMMMTEQLVATGLQQMLILGSFFDARAQLDTQRLFQELTARAHKDYQPSFDMCVIGTTARGLASADRNGEYTSFVLGQRSQDRQIGTYSANGAFDATTDREGRLRQVQTRYCDPRDNNNGLGLLCGPKSPSASINKDVDYTRTIDGARTLNIDFTDPVATGDEQDVLALASNLFSREVLEKPDSTRSGTKESEDDYLDMRAIFAKRSVAENSFNAIVGMKTAGTETSANTVGFTQKVLEQFGVTDENARRIMLGGTQDNGTAAAQRPSYYAQMEILAQKLYQDPEFYSNLYDKPANVLRKKTAMKAINLMLNRDMYKSELRSEMNLSVLLELELMKYQDIVQKGIDGMTEKYREN